MTDEILALKAKDGDEEAMNELLTKYKSTVNMLARSYFLVGGDMEDIVQEGMIGLYKAILSFSKEKASFKTFATICIKHQIQTAIRKASSQKNMLLSSALPIYELEDNEDDADKSEIILPSQLPSPDDTILANENMTELKKKIKQSLSTMEIKILALYLKGYSYNEISDIGGYSKKSIDNALSRIKNKLTFLKKAE